MEEESFQLNKSAFSVTSLSEQSDDRAYWQSCSPEERLAAIELMRQLNYDYDPASERLSRVFEVVERTRS
ncbi:hypothetical protein [Longibacter salinarum]|uniref:hypothetical protein n=1 Tax=Longibacter salinarum TaxID=1850348 RepID=UPI0015CF042E|nr:hypothetical protein [Longibacter salinarum]